MENELIAQLTRLLERTGINSGHTPASGQMNNQAVETMLMEAKALNARYDKNDAIAQVQWLMDQYNIQIDELLERISK